MKLQPLSITCLRCVAKFAGRLRFARLIAVAFFWVVSQYQAFSASNSGLYNVDPTALSRLETGGAAFEKVVGAGRSLLRITVERELSAFEQRIRLVRTAGYIGSVRRFDARWLTAHDHFFRLIAVVARPDRALNRPANCGEWRLIYRLHENESLAKGNDSARGDAMPVTVNVIFDASGDASGSCGPALSTMALPDAESPANLVAATWKAWRQSGIVSAAGQLRAPDRVELNLQLARLADDGRGTFSDQSQYLLLAFRRDQADLVPDRLENTIDTDRLAQDAPLRQKLKAWLLLRNNLRLIAAGTAVVPSEFLARSAISVAPLGPDRLANRPFSSVFRPEEFTDRPLAEFPELKTPAGLLRRLDALSCAGCHESRAIAGFHVLGFDRVPGKNFDRLRDPLSAHFTGIQAWREKVRLGRLRKNAAIPAMPDPLRTDVYDRAFATCGLGDEAFAAWKCGEGQECTAGAARAENSPFGRCRDEVSNDGCDAGILRPEVRAENDVWTQGLTAKCGEKAVCATTQQGFPGGLCSRACKNSDEQSLCVPVPVLGDFSVCLDASLPFGACLRDHHVETTMMRCRANRDCRPDFVCIDPGSAAGEDGICAPPYFLPQLTIEHRGFSASTSSR